MNRETQHWVAPETDKRESSRSSVTTLITAELPETRIFIDRLYHEFTASGRRIQTDRMVQSRGDSPWFSAYRERDERESALREVHEQPDCL